MSKIPVTSSITIDRSEIIEKFVRSGGPGGQNVNKLSTAVQLRFNVKRSPNLPDRIKARILNSGDSRITKAGEIVIFAETGRTREANRREALDRLVGLIRQATRVQKPRVPTKPSKSSVNRRLDTKTKRGQLKKVRSGKISPD